MRKGSIFISIALVILVNLFFQFFWGESGWLAYKDLQEQQKALESQLLKLEHSNGILQGRLSQLQRDRQLLKQEAGRLHYIDEHEVLVLTSGWGPSFSQNRQDEILRVNFKETSYRKSFFRGISFIAGLSIILLQMLLGKGRKENPDKPLSHIL